MGTGIPFGINPFSLLTLIRLGIGIPLGFITRSEKWNYGRFSLGVIDPTGFNQFFHFSL